MGDKRYLFREVTHCEMCGDATNHHKILGQRLNTSQGYRPKNKTGISVSVKKCTNCNLIYSFPQPIPFDIQDHYGIPPEEYWVEDYFKPNPDYFINEMDILKRLTQIKPGMKSLDVGAGLGKSMTVLSNAGFDAYGFEPSVTFYEKAISKMNISPEKLKYGTIEEMEYEENSFDFITLGVVLEHVYSPSSSLEKAYKWLKPGGIIHIEVPSSNHLVAKIFNLYYRLMGTNYVTSISPMHSPFHLYEFGYKSFAELSKKVPYKIIFHEYYVCDIYHIPRIFHLPLQKIMKWTNTGMNLAIWLQK